MSRISGGLGRCFDTVSEYIRGDRWGQSCQEDAERGIESIEEAFERRVRYVSEARGLAHRLTGMIEAEVAWLRSLSDTLGGDMDTMHWSTDLKQRGDALETRLLTELGAMSLDNMPAKALVELGVAIVAALERRGITAFPVQLGGDGKIQGPGAPEDGP